MIVAVIDASIYGSYPDFAYKILRLEDSKLANYLNKTPDEIIGDCFYEFNANYNIDGLKKEIADLQDLFHKSYHNEEWLENVDSTLELLHGFIIAEIISMMTDDVLILPLKASTKESKGFNLDLAIEVAIKQNTKIINLSIGGKSNSDIKDLLFFEKTAKKYPDVLFVVSAGNEGLDFDDIIYSDPIDLPNLIFVSAVDCDNYDNCKKLSDYSNYGSKVVDVAAIGKVDLNNWNLSLKGTSFAAPHIVSLAANIMQKNPSLSIPQIKKIICDTVDRSSDLEGKLKCGGAINKNNALLKANSTQGDKTYKNNKNKKCINQDCFLDLLEANNLLCLASKFGHENLARFSIKKINVKNETIECYGANPLCLAANKGYDGLVKILIEAGMDVNQKDSNGATPLFFAAQEGHEAMFKFLLAKGADINKAANNGATPLYVASQNGYDGIVQLLADRKADTKKSLLSDGRTPLYVAAENGHTKIVEILVGIENIDVDQKEQIHGATPLLIASYKNHFDTVKLLINAKANINESTDDNVTSLYFASQEGYNDIAQLLIDRGAYVDCTRKIDNTTPLYVAALNGHKNIVESLITAKANANTTNIYNSPPLITASEQGHEDIVRILIEKGHADINIAVSDLPTTY